MLLYINTSNAERITIGLDNQKYETAARKDKSQKLLPFIIDTLESQNKTLKDITQIEVFTGPGSFVGLRVGVSVANALGWSLQVPVNGKMVAQGKSIKIQYE